MSTPLDGNMYPNDGAAFVFRKPAAQVAEQEAETRQVASTIPLLQEIIDRFDEKIAFYKSVDSVSEDVLTVPEEFMHVIAANKLAAACLGAEREYIASLIEDFERKL